MSDLFRGALDLEGAARDDFLAQACAGDVVLRAEVESLLDEAARPWSAFEEDAPREALRSLVEVEAPVPERFGGFRIVGVLGRGGMGVVYDAEQEQPRRRVALKVISAGRASRSLLRRFEQEAEMLARLQHPGIAAIHETGTIDQGAGGQAYFAMERVDGLPLTEHAERHHLDRRARLELMASIADAVQHAHARGVIHRDLKPANILVTEDGRAKVLDFGVARATDADLQLTSMRTETGQLLGTLEYMSPEQANGDAHALDTRSDVYALGVLLYELLAGRRPHDVGRMQLATAARVIVEEDPPPLGALDRSLRGDVETIVATAMEKDPERRFGSAAAFAEDIRRALRDEPIVARPPTRAYLLRKFARRHRALVGGLAATLLVLTAGVVTATILAVRENAARRVAETRFEDLRELSGTVLFRLHDAVRELPGSTEARELIVSTSLDYLERLALDAGDDPSLLAELVRGYARIGTIQGYPQGQNLGDLDGALVSFQRAHEYCRRLLAIDPAHPLRETDVTLWADRAAVLRALDRADEADAADDAFVDAARRLHASDPANASWSTIYSTALHRLGDRAMAKGDADGALALYTEARDLRRAIFEASDGSLARRGEYAAALARMADAERARERFDAAIADLEACLALRRENARIEPLNPRWTRDVAFTLGRIGMTCIDGGRYADATAPLLASHEERAALHAMEPANALFHRDLAVAEYRLGAVHDARGLTGESGQWGEAARWFERARDTFVEIREAGALRPSDEGVIEAIEGDLARCRRAAATDDGGS